MINDNIGVKFYIFFFFDGFLLIIPPILTIYLQMSKSWAMLRLKRKNILGLQPDKIISAGKVSVCCFDKTGTLTKNDVEIVGHQSTINGNHFKSQNINFDVDPSESLQFKLFATCHSVHNLDGEFVGDTLDVQMMKYSKWKYISPQDYRVKFIMKRENSLLEVMKVFEFASEFLRMSVVVKHPQEKNTFIFSKGAPEVLTKICKESTIPKDFNSRLYNLTIKGLRILAIGYKEFPYDISNEYIEHFRREEAESNLNFAGFLISENKLKEDTSKCLFDLKSANLELKIISGDNPLTTIQAAREANIIEKNESVMLVSVSESDNLVFEIIEDQYQEKNALNNPDFNKINKYNDKEVIEFILQNTNQKQIAMTGKVYEHIKNKLNSPYSNEHYQNLLIIIIKECKIYSRMKPDQKSEIILDQQSRGVSVLMVGDGANDCSALKQADVGISFSDADSSFCAPFSSLNTGISCLEKVLLERRGAVTNCVEIFRFIMASGFYGYLPKLLWITKMSKISDFQSLYKNFLNIIPKIGFYSLSPPVDKISKHKPRDNLV
jgi:cation-transporting ATPase 13A2